MEISESDLQALAERVSVLVTGHLAKTICIPTIESLTQETLDRISVQTIALARANGERIDRLEQTIAHMSAADAHQKTAEALLADPKFEQLLANAYERMLDSAKKRFDGWMGKRWLSSGETAKLIGITSQALSVMRKRHEGPPWHGKGKLLRYDRIEVERWLSELPT